MKNQKSIAEQLENVLYHVINNGESDNNDAQCKAEFLLLMKMLPDLTETTVADFVRGAIISEVISHSDVYLQYVDTPNAMQELITNFTNIFNEIIL
jgi:hypothetical protein